MNVQVRRLSFRGLLALLLLLASLLTVSVASAAPEAQTAIDVFCVTGSVIDHAEKPSGGWTITAVMYNPATGLLDPATAVDTETINVDNDPAGPLGSFRFDGLQAGVWNFSIGTQAGWSPVTSASFDVPLAYGRTDCATIRFKMRQVVIVEVLKIDAYHNPLAGFIIHAKPAAGNFFASATPSVRSSTAMMSVMPRAFRPLTRLLPIKPAAPVTTIFMGIP